MAGEWWRADVEAVEKQGRMLGKAPNTSDAHTINGKPGPLFPCSEKHTYALEVRWGKTYLLRIVNAAVNDELFFSIAGHTMTVVEIDATYTKPLTASTIHLSPGQTTNVLVRADRRPGRYFMAAKPFNNVPVPADNKTAAAILQLNADRPTANPLMHSPRNLCVVDTHRLHEHQLHRKARNSGTGSTNHLSREYPIKKPRPKNLRFVLLASRACTGFGGSKYPTQQKCRTYTQPMQKQAEDEEKRTEENRDDGRLGQLFPPQMIAPAVSLEVSTSSSHVGLAFHGGYCIQTSSEVLFGDCGA
ncbi:hypothetical protein C2845_PM07G16690 [Panicum miliaceum]|uniref:laccase n=1 Tax=Panicum miliaceum TaxID=4540 RepID=A0A3L6SN27_PANMI|nr:hypothetical protein C2845_PM07G16690 [Panicum miliaceum]